MANFEKFSELKAHIDSLSADADKFFNKGNGAAGTRLRKGLQDLKSSAQALRLSIQEAKNAEGKK